MRTLGSEWAEFTATVLSADASQTQREEMKRAFYAGALCALTVLADAVEGQRSEQVMRLLTARLLEVRDEAVAYGRAQIRADEDRER